MTCDQLSLSLPSDPRRGATRRRGCVSSLEGARMVDASRQRDLIARELAGALHGLTADELEERLGIKREHLASRLSQMKRWDEVYTLGKRVNANGIAVQLWFLKAGRP